MIKKYIYGEKMDMGEKGYDDDKTFAWVYLCIPMSEVSIQLKQFVKSTIQNCAYRYTVFAKF